MLSGAIQIYHRFLQVLLARAPPTYILFRDLPTYIESLHPSSIWTKMKFSACSKYRGPRFSSPRLRLPEAELQAWKLTAATCRGVVKIRLCKQMPRGRNT